MSGYINSYQLTHNMPVIVV